MQRKLFNQRLRCNSYIVLVNSESFISFYNQFFVFCILSCYLTVNRGLNELEQIFDSHTWWSFYLCNHGGIIEEEEFFWEFCLFELNMYEWFKIKPPFELCHQLRKSLILEQFSFWDLEIAFSFKLNNCF